MRKTRSFMIIVLVLISLSSCSKQIDNSVKASDSKLLLGTVCTISLFDSDDESIIHSAFLGIEEIEYLMSREIETSDVSEINQSGEPVNVDEQTLKVLQEAIMIAEVSDGRFDPSIEPVVSAWGIGTEEAGVPDPQVLEELLSHVDYRKIIVDTGSGSVSLSDPEMSIDLGGIAKGYAADMTVGLLREEGVSSALINLGGNIFTLGSKPDGSPWRIGIQNPDSSRGDYIGLVEITDYSVVTSGIYERFFEDESGFYHHILDTRTGYPVRNSLKSVTIISPNSLLADGLSTAAFALGLDEGRALIESYEGIEAVFITETDSVYTTSGLSDGTIPFTITDEAFTLEQDQ